MQGFKEGEVITKSLCIVNQKKERLNSLISDYLQSGLVLALSGGVDSTLLLALISRQRQKQNAVAVTFATPLYPKEEISIAKNMALKYGIEHNIIPFIKDLPDELLTNSKARCYHCKKAMFLKAKNFAEQKGLATIIDGTNADDLKVYRPGKQALDELGVLSPLAITGFSKTEIRKYADELHLKTAKRPSTPCLATRLPYDTKLDFRLLEKINRGECFLSKLGFEIIRLRFHEPVLRIEIEKSRFAEFISQSEKITVELKKLGFKYITLDMSGFKSGGFDE
ncbi:MAG: TIGR00268 family protein [Treponema sp.]|nr:MAG: TIGR00268 family protein [Treponema sp.]